MGFGAVLFEGNIGFYGKSGFDYARKFGVRYHDLRHTHATLLLANGIDVVAVASRMGHGDPMVTLRTYAHVLARRDRDAAHVLDGLFGDVELPPPPRLPDDEK